MERQFVTEKMHPEKEWFEEAKKVETIDGLASFTAHMLYDYHHDYGTACHAIAACAIAAASVGSHEEGITVFQAGFVMWDFIRHWNHEFNKTGMRLVDYDDMLYPQYEYKFDKTIDKDNWECIRQEAARKLEEHKVNCDPAHPDVLAHWKSIMDGHVPFGYKVVDRI